MRSKTNKRIFLSPPDLNGLEKEQLNQVLESNYVAPIGSKLTEFEEQVKSITGAKYGVALNSGTSAIHLGLKALGVGKGDHVLVQSHTHVGCVNPILYEGAISVFIDSELETWNMSPDFLEEAITDLRRKGIQPKAIIPVHIYGMPAKMKEISRVAFRYEIPILEDAAEALGSSYQGDLCGNLADTSVISFNGNKIVTTGGGGVLLCSSESVAAKVRYWANQSKDKLPYYSHKEVGYNYALSNVSAGIGIAQLKDLNRRIERKREVFDLYVEYFDQLTSNGYSLVVQPETSGSFSNRWLTAVLIDPEKNGGTSADTVREKLAKNNIESRPVWKPMHLQPLFKDSLFYGSSYSEELFETGLCFPSGSGLLEEEQQRVLDVLAEVFH